jgi:two-component system chemotaxis response regulator CheB
MIARRIVVIGASAGGIDVLRTLIANTPDTIPAAICVVLHTSPESPGLLPQILGRTARLRVATAFDRQRLEAGRVYLAPPDRHLLVEPGRLRVTKGPREHSFRPAIDPLFRSAAQVYGPAAIGVILTGNLDDGVAGLWTIKKLGGTAIVQDPAEALHPSMPSHAVNHVAVDYVVPASEIPSLLASVTTGDTQKIEPADVPKQVEVEVNIAKEQNPRAAGLEEIGKPSPYACPECHGVLLELKEGATFRFRCHIGHAYSLETLLAAMNDGIEHAMGTAMRSLEEGSLLMKDAAEQLQRQNRLDAAQRMTETAERARRAAEAIRELILTGNVVPGE